MKSQDVLKALWHVGMLVVWLLFGAVSESVLGGFPFPVGMTTIQNNNNRQLSGLYGRKSIYPSIQGHCPSQISEEFPEV